MRDDASEAQVQAAEPGVSTWLSANAGSGKTRVLIDRVARLLLRGTPPQRILCLTYTNAAASEMQNRLFKRLGEWAMMPEGKLAATLVDLGAEAGDLAEARRLFARAIETPGGLRIQTIHSFCASLLRRFPLEAGVAPQFTEIDERTRRQVILELLEQMAEGTGAALVSGMGRLFGEAGFFEAVERVAELRRHLRPQDRAEILRSFGLAADQTLEALNRQALEGLPDTWAAETAARLMASGSNDQKLGRAMTALTLVPENPGLLEALESLLLFKEDSKTPFQPKAPTKGWCQANPALFETFSDLAQRVADLRPQRLALQAAEAAALLSDFAAAFLPRFAAAKAARGWLDFDDLIERAEALLTDPSVAAWVLFRLDGGIDHILVDEAQDTSPDQWRVIDLLTQEFTAGLGARGQDRTLFVVGDKKQSIYSFQGADVTGFDARNQAFRAAFRTVGLTYETRELRHSFRSSSVVLGLVDALFGDRFPQALGPDVRHIAFHPDLPGRVEWWPAIGKDESAAEDEDWSKPVDLVEPEAPAVVLADRVAARIKAMIGVSPVPLMTGGHRAARAGDFLILVRRRSGVFGHLIRACKAAGLPVAGADRLKLSEELAARDLLALLSFLATPEDDLSLATLLRSPLCGWSEDDLFRLAYGRKGYVWEALRDRGGATLEMLQDLRDQVDFLRPHDLLDRALTRHRGRVRLLARLGEEVEESIDALLAQALAYESVEVPSLDGFLAWMQGEDATIKRQMGEAADKIRIMTVHGAKGLEGEIVILPDTGTRRSRNQQTVVLDAQGLPMPSLSARERPPALAEVMAAREAKEEEESLRLLYVALTRARTQALIAACGDAAEGCWHDRVGSAMQALGARADAEGRLVLASANWPADLAPEPGAAGPETAGAEPVPAWARARAPAARPRVKPLSPSDLGGAKALPGAPPEPGAKDRGTALHLLLQHLPGQPDTRWPMLARFLVPDEALCAAVLPQAAGLIRDPALAEVFGPASLAEAAIAGDLFGQRAEGAIDRLVVTPDRILAVDFKSNRIVPDSPRDVPEAILRQMGAYAVLLGQVWPGRAIGTAVLWTQTGRLMALDDDIVRQALQRATTDGGLDLDVPAGQP